MKRPPPTTSFPPSFERSPTSPPFRRARPRDRIGAMITQSPHVLTVVAAVEMPQLDQGPLEVIVYCVAGLLLLFAGYRLGRLIGKSSAARAIAARERELFTAQKGFKSLYEMELANARAEN